MSTCGICGWPGRHVHDCVRCGEKLTVKGADWIVRQPVNAGGTLGELVVEHSTVTGGCSADAASSGDPPPGKFSRWQSKASRQSGEPAQTHLETGV